ncbi:MAG: acyl-CoA dehydrogenase FadE [Gammaproteobacteria bacterium]|nr:MAG: acyl-CoA dehydrogenase FadE [Gammaproteobacteria bacterium]
MGGIGWWAVLFVVIVVLAYLRTALLVNTLVLAGILGLYTLLGGAPAWLLYLYWGVFALLAILLNAPPLRRALVSNRVLKIFRHIMPAMSQTEREALAAGTVWWDADLFSGKPDWKKLLAIPAPGLSADEQAFLDGPVDELCGMVNDWEINHTHKDLPPEVWQYLKDKGFFGMIIPRQYGGLEFSAMGHSAVVMKIASRSVTAAVTVMVPNSLGPAELLLHYGTEQQKDYYLPRLAKGQEIPCFALTGPEAGSDAGAMPDTGVVCKGEFEGKTDVLGIRLNWQKRYITLGPVATILGLAFKLYDPDHLLGETEEIGITVALIPTKTPGVEIGRRHNPLNIVFQVGPNSGKDVFIPMDWIIGGADRVGQGWRMLMESLAAGRSISLPALGVGSGKLASRSTGAYARIRRQFNMPIGKFEGVEEALARIAGYTYMMDAVRVMTAGAVDAGEQPSVISAIAKYQMTEHMRQVVNDAMDVRGGSGICIGPHNLLGRVYQGVPISITVEGANILTRSLIIYGQGAIRCHPYVFKELEAVRDQDHDRASRTFDRALFGHLGFTISNAVRAVFLGLSSGLLAPTPVGDATARYYQHLSRISAAFAFASDMAMLVLGGSLKRKEKLSGRLADVLSHLYLASATLKRFQDQDRPKDDLPFVKWNLERNLYLCQQALDEFLRNFPNRAIASIMRPMIFPLGRHFRPPSDRLGHAVADVLLQPSEARERLTEGLYISADSEDAIGRVEHGLGKVIAAEAAAKKLRKADINYHIRALGGLDAILAEGIKQNVIDEAEAELVKQADAARRAVIKVDDFSQDLE